MTTSGCASMGASRPTSNRLTIPITESRTNDQRHPTRRRERARQQQRDDLGERDGRGQEADRLTLLLALIVAGDDDGHRRCSEGHHGATECLDAEEHPSLVGERDRDRCDGRADHADVQRLAGADLRADSSTEQHESRHGECARRERQARRTWQECRDRSTIPSIDTLNALNDTWI